MGHLLSDKELVYLKNSKDKSIKKYERGQLKSRVEKKLKNLNIGLFSEEISYLTHEEIIRIIKKIIYHLYSDEFESTVNDLSKELKDSENLDRLIKNEQRDSILFRKELKRVNRIKLRWGELRLILNGCSKTNYRGKIKKNLRDLYNSKRFVLDRKFYWDKKFIIENNRRKEIFNLLKLERKSHLISDLTKKFHEYSIRRFCELGIIIPKDETKQSFLDKCRKKILSDKRFRNSFSNPIYPYSLKSIKNKKLKINLLYINEKNLLSKNNSYFTDLELPSKS